MRVPKRCCHICEILLKKTYRRKYCDDCAERYGRYLYNLWHRRAYQKRVGKEQDPIRWTVWLTARMKPRILEPKRKEEMKKMRAQGMTFSAISKHFNVSKAYAHKVVMKL